MAKNHSQQRIIVYADWAELSGPEILGILNVSITRGQEVFSFEYDDRWLKSGFAQVLDPDLALYSGRQYLTGDRSNFGIFLDSAPDRWGRLLMKRREAAQARSEDRQIRTLFESDYLLGVYDGHRMGALRFKTDPEGDFLDNNRLNASPPWTALRDLEYASLQLEKAESTENPEYHNWLSLLLVPGSSLGGARPKASVFDSNNELWIAKFPSKADPMNIGAWEMVTHQLAKKAGLKVPVARIEQFSGIHHSFLSKRFDRLPDGKRIHYASALTMLGYKDGSHFKDGASYLEIAEFLIRNGANVSADLEELWRRIVFSICVSNTDDHLRNHGFILNHNGWSLSPAFDINPDENGNGLSLNISEDDNSLDLGLAKAVAPYFRLNERQSSKILSQAIESVRRWRTVAKEFGISVLEQEMMSRAFQAADN